jgi:hypothetical protein
MSLAKYLGCPTLATFLFLSPGWDGTILTPSKKVVS